MSGKKPSPHVEKRIRRACEDAEALAIKMLTESDETPKLQIIVRYRYPGYAEPQAETWEFEPIGTRWRKHISAAIRRVGSMFISATITPAKKPISIEERDRILDEMEAEESAQ